MGKLFGCKYKLAQNLECVSVCLGSLTEGLLSSLGLGGIYQCSFYKDPKANSRSTFIWKITTSLVFIFFFKLLQTGCRTFSNGFTQETGWLRPFLPVYSGLCPVQTHIWCRERIFLPWWFHFRVQREVSSTFAAACKFAFFVSLQSSHKLERVFRKKFQRIHHVTHEATSTLVLHLLNHS